MSRKLKRNSEDHGSAPTPITRPTTRSAKKLKVEITEEDCTEDLSAAPVSSSMSGADSDEGSVELGPPEPIPPSVAVNGDPHVGGEQEQQQQEMQPSVSPSPPPDRVDSDSNVIVKVEELVDVPVEDTSCMDTPPLPTMAIKIEPEPDSDSRSSLVEPANCVVKEEQLSETKEENAVPHHEEEEEVIGGCEEGAEMQCGLVDVSTSQDVTEEMDMEMSDEEEEEKGEEEEEEEGDLDGRRTPPPRNHPSLTVHLNTPATPTTKHAYFNPPAQVQAQPVSAGAAVPGFLSPIPLSTSTNTPILATSPSSSSIPSVSSTPSVLFVRPTQQSTGPDPAERQRAMDAWLQIKEQIERESEERARAAAAEEEERRVAMAAQEELRRAMLKQQEEEAAVLRAQQEKDREEAARLKHIHRQQQEMARQAEEVERQKREKEKEAEKAAKKEAEETRRREREEEKRAREQEKENERKKTPPHFEAILTNEYMVKMDKKDNEEYTCYCETDCPDKYSPGVEICYNIVCQQECPKNCQAVGCRNRRMANREYAKIEVFDAGSKGHGVRALEKIKKDRLIIEYVGEVMTKDAFEKRKDKYAKHNHTHHYFMSIDKNIVDATKRGNISRFINHSCDPNAYCEPWLVDRRKRMGFFALRDIEVGEEICFDYKFRNYGQNLQQCFCGTAKCTGFIGVWDKDHVAEEEEVEDDDEEEEVEEEEQQGRLTKIRRQPRNKYANMDQHELMAAASEMIRKGLHNQKEALRFMKMVSCVDDHGELQLMIMRFIVQIKEQFIIHCLVKHFLLFLLTSWLRGWMGNLDMMRTDAHLRQRVVAFIMVIMHLPLALDKLDETKEAGDLTQLINDLVALKKGKTKEKEGEEKEGEEEEGDVEMEEDENKNEMLQDIASMAERCVVRFQGLSKTAYRIPKKQAAAAPVVAVAAEPDVKRERWRMKAGREAVPSARQSERDSPVDKERDKHSGAGWLSGRNTPGGRFSGRNTPNGHSHSGRSTPSGHVTPSETERRDKETQPVQRADKTREPDVGEVKPRVPNTIPIPDGEPIIRVDCTTADVRRNIPSWVRQGAMMHHHHTAAPMPFHQMPPPPFQIPPPSMNPMMWNAPHFMPPMGMGMMAAPPPPPPPAAADNEERNKERRRSRFDRTADGGALSRAMAEAMKAELDMEGPGLVSCVSVQAKDPELSAITDHEFYRHPLPGSPDVEQLIQWHEAQLALLRALASQRAGVAAAGEASVAGSSSVVSGEEPMDVTLTPVALDALSSLPPSTSMAQPGLSVSALSLGMAPLQPLAGPALLPSLHQLPLLPGLMAMPPLADVAAAAASFLSPTKRPPMTPPEPDVAVAGNVAEEQWLACKDETGDVYYYSDVGEHAPNCKSCVPMRTREARWDLPFGVTAIAGPGFPAGEAVPQKREGEGEGEGDSSRPPSSAGMAAAAPSQDQVVSTTTQVNSKKEFRCELGKMIQQALKAVHSRMSKGESEFREVARLLNREIVQKEEKLPNCTYEMTRETRGRCMEHIKKVIEYKYPSSATRKKLDEPPSYGPPPTHPQ